MTENKTVEKVENTCKSCEALKAELELVKEDLVKANATIKQYDEAYKELQNKYSRLYTILGNQIEQTLNIK